MIDYCEDFANIKNGWTELLNKYGDDDWQLCQVVPDELDQDGTKHPGRHRLIFMRAWEEDEDEDDELDESESASGVETEDEGA